jgi:hypothetical protein
MALTQAGTKPAVEYPSTDGEPMAQNTKQYRYITTIQPATTGRSGSRDYAPDVTAEQPGQHRSRTTRSTSQQDNPVNIACRLTSSHHSAILQP